MISLGDAAAFVVAKLQRLQMQRPITSLPEFEIAATQAARLVKGGLIGLDEAADDLLLLAAKAGLTARHGIDKVQARMDAALEAVEREMAIRYETESRIAKLDDATLDAITADADAKEAAKLGLQITPISKIDIRAIEWLWPDRIALGKLLLVAGNGGIGKSTLLFEIAARVSRGETWPDGKPGSVPQTVFLMSSEDDPADTIRPRLEAAGADLGKIYFVSMVREQGGAQRMFNLQADIERLEERIRQVGDVGLVVIDPVTGYLGKADSNSGTDVRRILTPLGDMAMRTRSADALDKKDDGESKSAKQEAVEFLKEVLSAEPLAVAEVTETGQAHGFSPKALRIARERLGIKAKKINQVWTWALPS